MTTKQMFVYIMANPARTTLYTGVTSDLIRRVHEHKGKSTAGFTARYNVTDLVYYEVVAGQQQAIEREKQIKGGSRARKDALIASMNPEWRDMYGQLIGATEGEPARRAEEPGT